MVYYGHVYSEIFVMALTDFSKNKFGVWDLWIKVVSNIGKDA